MRILVVEDEEDLAGAVAAGLRREGYAVDVAGDGRPRSSASASTPTTWCASTSTCPTPTGSTSAGTWSTRPGIRQPDAAGCPPHPRALGPGPGGGSHRRARPRRRRLPGQAVRAGRADRPGPGAPAPGQRLRPARCSAGTTSSSTRPATGLHRRPPARPHAQGVRPAPLPPAASRRGAQRRAAAGARVGRARRSVHQHGAGDDQQPAPQAGRGRRSPAHRDRDRAAGYRLVPRARDASRAPRIAWPWRSTVGRGPRRASPSCWPAPGWPAGPRTSRRPSSPRSISSATRSPSCRSTAPARVGRGPLGPHVDVALDAGRPRLRAGPARRAWRGWLAGRLSASATTSTSEPLEVDGPPGTDRRGRPACAEEQGAGSATAAGGRPRAADPVGGGGDQPRPGLDHTGNRPTSWASSSPPPGGAWSASPAPSTTSPPTVGWPWRATDAPTWPTRSGRWRPSTAAMAGARGIDHRRRRPRAPGRPGRPQRGAHGDREPAGQRAAAGAGRLDRAPGLLASTRTGPGSRCATRAPACRRTITSGRSTATGGVGTTSTGRRRRGRGAGPRPHHRPPDHRGPGRPRHRSVGGRRRLDLRGLAAEASPEARSRGGRRRRRRPPPCRPAPVDVRAASGPVGDRRHAPISTPALSACSVRVRRS